MKIAVIGRGTAGCMSALMLNHKIDAEIEWYFDPSIKPQAVGEGSTLKLPSVLHETLNFSAKDFHEVDATIKTGIYKEDWGSKRKPFLHDFPSPHTAIHFNANKLQDYVHSKLKNHINVIPKNVKSDNVDADFVLDCSGRPDSYEAFDRVESIPVNAVHVTQCYWEYPRFNYTLAIARPYGWVFGIPLQNRCSVGYLYNKDINTLEEIKEDVLYIFDRFNLTPSEDTNSFSFNNYKRKENFNGNIAYNGNASFFLEPLEATTFGCVANINQDILEHWIGPYSKEESEERYKAHLTACESIIMLHYYSGSSFNTHFWEYAKEKGRLFMEGADESLLYMMKNSKTPDKLGSYGSVFRLPNIPSVNLAALYSAWWEGSFAQNIEGLNIKV